MKNFFKCYVISRCFTFSLIPEKSQFFAIFFQFFFLNTFISCVLIIYIVAVKTYRKQTHRVRFMNFSTPFPYVSECNWKNINGLLPLLHKALSVWAFLQRCLDKFEQPSVNFFFFFIFTDSLTTQELIISCKRQARQLTKTHYNLCLHFTEEKIRPYIELKLFQ